MISAIRYCMKTIITKTVKGYVVKLPTGISADAIRLRLKRVRVKLGLASNTHWFTMSSSGEFRLDGVFTSFPRHGFKTRCKTPVDVYLRNERLLRIKRLQQRRAAILIDAMAKYYGVHRGDFRWVQTLCRLEPVKAPVLAKIASNGFLNY